MRSRILAALVGVMLTAGSVASDEGLRVHTVIPPQPLEKALRALATKRNFQLVYVSEEVATRRTQGVTGDLTTDEALRRLLEGTGLVHRYLDAVTVAIEPAALARPGTSAETASPATRDTAPAPTNRRTSDSPSMPSKPTRLAWAWLSAGSADANTGSDSIRLEEVIVTSQKRSESSLNVPISMTVLGARELEARRVLNIDDYAFSIPNATFTKESDGNPRISLRGMSAGLSGGKFEPIAVTVDEVSFGATNTGAVLYGNLLDIERIEVLRGPQGTLSGSNSLGGTINLITAKPHTRAFEATGTLDVSRFNTMLAKGMLNLPLSHSLAVRTVAYLEQSDGAIRNVGPSGGSSSADYFGAHVALRWQATDALRFDTAFSYDRQDRGLDTGLNLDRYYDGEAGRQAAIAQIAALGGNYFSVDFIDKVGTNGGNVRYDIAESIDITDWTATFRATYQMREHALDLIYGHHDWQIVTVGDNDRSEFAFGDASTTTIDPRDTSSESIELRLTSEYSGSLNWVGGLVYIDDVFTGAGHFDRGDGRYAGNYSFSGVFAQYQSLQSVAAFGNVFWDITDRLHLSAGARYSEVKTQYGFACCGTGPGVPLAPISLQNAKLGELTPRVALTFDLNDRANVYVQFATGYRAGYGNATPAVGRHQTSLGLLDVPAEVDSEHVKNYEVGLKSRFLEDRAALNLAVFHMDYDDLQAIGGSVLDIPGGELFGFDINAGRAYARGFELEGAVRATAGLELRGSVGYVDTHVDELAGGIRDVVIPAVRPWTSIFSAIYEASVATGLRAHFRGDYIWQARAYSEFGANSVDEVPQFSRVDISTGVSSDRWNISAYMQNVFDEKYWIGTSGGFGLHGVRAAIIPRTFGLRVSLSLERT